MWWLSRRPRREIFSYHDGERRRRIDPLEAWNALWSDPECRPEVDIGPAQGIGDDGQQIPFDPEAQQRVLAMTRRVFGLKSYDQCGLTIDETLSVLAQYLTYMGEIKKKRDRSRTPFPRSGSVSSTAPSATRPESGSSSTSPGSTSSDQPSRSKRSVRL